MGAGVALTALDVLVRLWGAPVPVPVADGLEAPVAVPVEALERRGAVPVPVRI